MRELPRLALRLSSALLITAALSSAALSQTDNRSGCSRDVTRHCRAVMDNGDMAVLACLKEHRAKLSKACQKVLTDHNQ